MESSSSSAGRVRSTGDGDHRPDTQSHRTGISGTLNDKVYLALPSHIQFTIYRIRKGMDIINPFLEETRINFPKEYDIAAKAAEIIGQTFHIEVPEDEIGFLTYHVYSAVSHVPVGHLVKASNVVGSLVKYIEEERQAIFDQEYGLCPPSHAFEILRRSYAEPGDPRG